MTTPTLELHITASGVEEVNALKRALAELNGEAGALRNIGQNASALDRLAQEMKDLRTDVVGAVRDIRTALVDGLKGTFQQASQVMVSGVEDMNKAVDAKMRELTRTIASEQVEAAKVMTETGEKVAVAAKAAGVKIGEAQAQGVEEGNVKVRLSYRAGLSGGASASLSVNGLGNYGVLMEQAKKVQAESPAATAIYEKEITKLEALVARVMKAATSPQYLNAGPAWWDAVLADQEAAEAKLTAAYEKSIVTLDKQVGSVMRAATKPQYFNAGPTWWEEILAEQDAAQAKIAAAYEKSIVTLDKQVASVMKAATKPQYFNAGPTWWEEILAEQEAAEAKIVAAYDKSILALEREVGKVMKAATQPQYFNAGPKWWEAVLAEQEAAKNKIIAQDVEIATQLARANKMAYSSVQAGSYGSTYNMPKEATPKAAELQAAAAGMRNLGTETEKTSSAFEHLSLNNARSRREIGTIISEGAGGNWGRLRSSVMALANATGLFSLVMTPMGAILTTAAAGVITLGLALAKGEEESHAFKDAMVLTNGQIGLTKGQFDALARTVANDTVSSIGTAKEALMDMAKTGRFTGDSLKVLAEDIVLQSNLTGEKLESVVKEYAKMPDGIHKWAEEHNKSMHFMSMEQLEHVRLLELQGEKQKAMIEVGEALNAHLKAQTENLGYLEAGWRGLKIAASAAWDAMLGLGREQTIDEKIAKVRDKIADATRSLNEPQKAGDGTQAAVKRANEAVMTELQENLRELEKMKSGSETAAAQRAQANVLNEEGIAGDKYLHGLNLTIDRTRHETEVVMKATEAIEKHNAAWMKLHPGDTSTRYNPVDDSGYIDAGTRGRIMTEIHQKYNGANHGNNYALEATKQEFKDEESVITTAYANERQLLQEQNHNKIIDQGQFQVKSLAMSAQYGEELIDNYISSRDAASDELQKKIATIRGSNMGADSKKQAIDKLQNSFDAWFDTQWTKIDNLTSKAATTDAKLSDQAVGEMNKLVAANDKYWAKAEQQTTKTQDLAKARRNLADASDEVRARFEAELKVQDSHTEKLSELQTAYDQAAASLDHFVNNVEVTDENIDTVAETYGDMADNVDKAKSALDRATESLIRMKQEAGDAAVDEVANKQITQIKNQQKSLSNTLASDIVSAITGGGHTALKKLEADLKQMFLSPVRIVLQAIIQPIANGLGDIALNVLGMGGSGASVGGSMSSLLSMVGSGSSASSFLSSIGTGSGALQAGGTIDTIAGAVGYGSGIAGAGASAAEIAATGEATSAALAGAGASAAEAAAASEALAVTMTETAAATTTFGAGLTAALAAIPVWGWIALAVIAIAAALTGGKGETRQGGFYQSVGEGAHAQFVQGPNGGQIAGDKVPGMLDAYEAGVNAMLKAVGSSDHVIAFQAGLESSKNGKGFAFAGGQLQSQAATGEWFGQNANEGPETNRGDLTPAQAVEKFGTELKQAALQALQAAADVPKAISAELAGVDIDGMTKDEVDKLTEKIMGIVKDANTLQEAVKALPFKNLSGLSFEAASNMNKMADGISNMTSMMSSFSQNFYTEGQRQDQTWKYLVSTFKDMNLVLPSTRAGYRDLVNGIDVSTESGQALYVKLLSLSSAFAGLYPALDETTDGLKSQTELLDEVTRAKDDLNSAYDAEKSRLQAVKDKMTALGVSLTSFMKELTMGSLSSLTPQDEYFARKGDFETTVADLTSTDPTKQANALDNIQQVSQDFLTASRAFNGASDGYNTDLASVQSAVQQASNIARSQVDMAVQQLAALDKLVTGLLDLKTTFVGSIAEVVAAINTLRAAQGAAGLPSGTVTGIPNPTTSTSGVGSGIGAGVGGIVISSGSSSLLAGLFQTELGRAPDAAGLAYYTNLLNNGTSLQDIDAMIRNSPEYKSLHGIPLATGMDRIPYDGFKATLHADETVLNREAASEWRSGKSGNSGNSGLADRIARLEAAISDSADRIVAAQFSSSSSSANKVVEGVTAATSRADFNSKQKDKVVIR